MLAPHSTVGLKRMGELNPKVFRKRAPAGKDADMWATIVSSKWQEELKDPTWHPFKVVGPEGKEEVIIRLLDFFI